MSVEVRGLGGGAVRGTRVGAHEGFMNSVKVVTGVRNSALLLRNLRILVTFLSHRHVTCKLRVIIVYFTGLLGGLNGIIYKYLDSCLACDKCSVSDSSYKKNGSACGNGYYNHHHY